MGKEGKSVERERVQKERRLLLIGLRLRRFVRCRTFLALLGLSIFLRRCLLGGGNALVEFNATHFYFEYVFLTQTITGGEFFDLGGKISSLEFGCQHKGVNPRDQCLDGLSIDHCWPIKLVKK